MTPIWIAGAVGVVVALGIGFWLWRSGALLWWYANQDGIDDEDQTSSDDASDRKENWHE